ncbi:MAG: protein kinase, partial [Candidatus Obscuribacterales bacterium]|nr:protein kinase [Candidatus Obscuribacterales bacterium]
MEGPVFKGAAFEGYLDDGEGEEELELAPESFPVDRFKPISELGRGAGGSVYLCRDRLLGKKVAIKVLHVLTGEQLIAFQEEARVTNKLDHPRIVSILDFGSTESGVPFMVLEYFPGETLREHLDNNGHMEEETARLVFLQVIDGLAYAHKRGIFHRDLK